MAEHTPAQIMAGIGAALNEGNMDAAASLIRYLATVDPDSAQMILDMFDLVKLCDGTET